MINNGLINANRFTFIDAILTSVHDENVRSKSANFLAYFLLKACHNSHRDKVNNHGKGDTNHRDTYNRFGNFLTLYNALKGSFRYEIFKCQYAT